MKDIVINGSLTMSEIVNNGDTGFSHAHFNGKLWRLNKRYIRMSGKTLEESDTAATGSWATCERVEQAQ